VLKDGVIQEIVSEQNGQSLSIETTIFHKDDRIDLALMKTDLDLSHYLVEMTTIHGLPEGFVQTDHIEIGGHLDDWLGDELVLSKVLLMGYRCPEGKSLQSNWRRFKNARDHLTQADTIVYRVSSLDCSNCSRRSECCPNTPHLKIARSIYESARDVARRIAQTDEFKQSSKQRKKVEIPFAHLKRLLKLDRLRLRVLAGARDDFILVATAQNLQRMAKLFPPEPGMQAAIAR
jgi:hypothetical protein